MLSGHAVSKVFGGLEALLDVNFKVKKGTITGLIGPNGAGKTTLFNCINSIYRPSTGNIYFNDIEITGLNPDRICRLGIGRTFQIVRPFLGMTGIENVLVGVLYGTNGSIGLREAKQEAKRHLDFVGLKEKKDRVVGSYTLADRKKLEIARALATDPELILLDEVVAGLTPTETLEAMKLIENVRTELDMTVFWIEHVMKALLNVADFVIVLHHGKKICKGTPKEVCNDTNVIKAYLGEEYML